MSDYIRGEYLKNKKSFIKLLCWIAPVICIGTAYILTPMYVQVSSYNWWYLLFLPFVAAYVSSSMISQEKKHNYHGLFGVIKDKSRLWNSKVIVAILYLTFANLLFCILSILAGFVFGQQINIMNNLFACIVLSAAFSWQVPLFMWIARKSNLFASVLVSIVGNFLIACLCATENYWWIPFSIPARLMSYIIHVLPNGLLIDPACLPVDYSIIAGGMTILVALFIALYLLTSRSFQKQEV